MSKIVRDSHIAEKIVFIDGISGSGKSMFGPILASMDNVERYHLEHIFEYLCLLHSMKKIETDAAVALMRIYADLRLYNSVISRDANFRPFDNTGFLNNPKKFRAIARLFSKDGAKAAELIKKDKPIFQTNAHQLFSGIGLAFKAFGPRLRVLEIVRNPIFLLKHWYNYIGMYGSTPRDMTLWVGSTDGKAVPWFAEGWEDEYIKLKDMERAIKSIQCILNKNEAAYNNLDDEQKKQVMIVPFERFVIDPWPFINKIESLLETKITLMTGRVLKRQKCPRKVLTAGRGHHRYGWVKPGKDSTDGTEAEKILKLVRSNASAYFQDMLEKMATDYDSKLRR